MIQHALAAAAAGVRSRPPRVATVAAGVLATTFTLQSTASGTMPFTIGLGIKEGDAIDVATDLTNYQVDVKRRWNDGSAKHVVISGRAALTADTPLTVNVTAGTPPSGTALTSADIATAAPTATVQCGALGTVSLADLLASPFRTWISGPEMVECHYRADVGGGTLLAVWFHVRLYADDRVHVRAVVENGYLDNGSGAVASNADQTYVPTVIVGGSTVYSNGGSSMTHCRNTRWMAEGWIGGDPAVAPGHDVTYLRNSKLVPNYQWSDPSETTLDALDQAYVPMGFAGIPPAMPTPGGNLSIAILPHWNSAFVGSGDPRAYAAVIANSSSLNSFGICWRDATTKLCIKPSAFANWSIYGPAQGGDRGWNTTNGGQWEINHHPGECYLAYLLTGDFWHYETMLLQTSAMYAFRGSSTTGLIAHGNGTSRVIVHEDRGTGWAIRSMSQLCALMPDAALGAGTVESEYRTLLANNMNYWKTTWADHPTINQLGMVYTYNTTGYGTGWSPCWMQFWWQQCQGFGSDIEPLADMTTYRALADWMFKGIVGILGDESGYWFSYASTYNIKTTDSSNNNPTEFAYPTWAQVYEQTFAHLDGGAASLATDDVLVNTGDMAQGQAVPTAGGSGDPADASFGRWGYLLPAIAYAVDRGVAGAAEAWARVSGASNFASTLGMAFKESSQWGVAPRSA